MSDNSVLENERATAEDFFAFEAPRGMDDSVGENFDAPESGSYTPRLVPKTQARFRFQLTPIKDRQTGLPLPGGFGKVAGDGGKLYDSAEYTAHVIVADLPDEAFIGGRPNVAEIPVRFNRINNAPKKRGLTGFGEMYRSLGLVAKFGDLTGTALVTALIKASKEGATGWCEIGWRYWDKASQAEYTTHPFANKIKDGKHVAWPIDEAGNYKVAINIEGQLAVGREMVAALLTPRAATK